MALATRPALVDLVAQIEVILQDSGCLLDLSAVLDASVCPTLDIFLPKPHTLEPVNPDHICVTPTESHGYKARAVSTTKKPATPRPRPNWCPKPTYDLDLWTLIKLGLVAEVDLQVYIKLLLELGINIDIDVALALLLDIDLDVDLGLGVGKPASHKAVSHYRPQCGKSIPANYPGCKPVHAPDMNSCLKQCYTEAFRRTHGTNVAVCAGVSFNPLVSVDACLIAVVDIDVGVNISLDIDIDVDIDLASVLSIGLEVNADVDALILIG